MESIFIPVLLVVPVGLLAIIITMKIENEDVLDELVICPQCHTLHKEIPIKDGAKACCSECGRVMYRYDSRLAEHGLALSITALIFFAVANFFPLVKIELLGSEQFITIPKTILSLFDNGFYVVGMICAFLIFIFPLMIFSLYLLIFTLLKFGVREQLSKELLVLLSRLKPWSMSDIFLISILVALVKLIGYAQIHMGISFWALIVFVLLDIYLTRNIHISEIWMLRKRVFLPKNDKEVPA
jgi:paraquat-inducible protein A